MPLLTRPPAAPPIYNKPPELVLPEPGRLLGPVAVDTETSGLYVDEGHRVCAVSVSLKLKDDPQGLRRDFAFPFDQGRHEEKGFEVQRYKDGRIKGIIDMLVDKLGLGHNRLPSLEQQEAALAEWTADHNLPVDQWRWLCDWLEASGHEVGHSYQNAQFDLGMFDAGLRTGEPGVWLEPYVVWDSMLVSKNLWPTELTGLKPTGERLWGAEAVADAKELKDYLLYTKKMFGLRSEHGPRYDLVPWEINGKYAASDTGITFDLKDYQHSLLNDGEGQGWGDFNREMYLMRVLTRMSRRGFGPYAVVESHEWANVIAGRLREIEPTLPFVRKGSLASDDVPEVDLAASDPEDWPIIGASAVRASEFYFEQLGLEPWKVGETRRGFEVGKGIHKKFVRGRKSDRPEIVRRFPEEATSGDITFKQGELTASIAARMGAEGAPGATDYAEFLRLKIANQMFYRNYAELAGPDNKLRTTYRQAFVKSGRMALPLDEPVLTPVGWRPIGGLVVGDLVVGGNGSATKIRAIPFEGDAEVWEVRTDDGAVVRCSDNHLWAVRLSPNRDSAQYREYTTEHLARRLGYPAARAHLPMQPVIEFDPVSLPVDPYVLGVLLGDGSFDSPCRWASHRDDMPEIAGYVKDGVLGHEVRIGRPRSDNCLRASIVGAGSNNYDRSPLATAIEDLGLRGVRTVSKFVPEVYLRGSVAERYALLRGLMDTDGSVRAHGRESVFLTSSPTLRDGVMELVRSVGGLARFTVRGAGGHIAEAYTVHIRTPECPFRLRRKSDKWVRASRFGRRVESARRTGGHLPMRCITVEAEDGLFVTRGLVVTHNSVEHFQAQALPKKLSLTCHGVPVPEPRSFFGVPEGHRRWNLDLSQAELRIAANLARCVGLMQELNEDGRDVHGSTCERTFGITPDHPDWKGKRDVAKRLNFGGIFMIGPKTFQVNLWTQGGIEWNLAQCKDAVYGFRSAYPEIEDAYKYWNDYAAQNNCVKLYNGQRSWFGRLDYPNTGWNRRVQGSLAVWVAEWLTLVEQITEKHDALVLSVHDSAVLDLPEDQDEDIVKRVLELSEELWVDRFGFPGKVDADTWTYHEGVDLLVPAHLARQFEGCE